MTDEQYEPNSQWCKHLQNHWVKLIVYRDKMNAVSEVAKHRSDMPRSDGSKSAIPITQEQLCQAVPCCQREHADMLL